MCLAFVVFANSDAMVEKMLFLLIESPSTTSKPSIWTLIEETKPLVFEKFEFELRVMSTSNAKITLFGMLLSIQNRELLC